MQFLVYVTVLMVSVSTVLLEVHWLTSPPPQPKPAVQTAHINAARPKIEGPNAELSPVYPRSETPRSVTAESNAQPADGTSANTNAEGATVQTAPVRQPAAITAAQPQQPMVDTTAKTDSAQKTSETTGVATRTDDASPSAAAPPAAPNRADNRPLPQPAMASNNHCDVQACASAYKSFRASDCSYQPFDGSRRLCEKPPVQRTARGQRDDPERRTWSRDSEPRNVERSVKSRDDVDDDIDGSVSDNDDDSGQLIVIRRHGLRW